MKTNNKARKKLIPAAAMLAVSAAMLTTATYAWFTMSREVSLENIQLTAAAPPNIQISLGDNQFEAMNSSSAQLTAKSGNDGVGLVKAPANTDNSKDWSNTVAFYDFYKVPRINPASSTTGASIFTTDDITGVGRTVAKTGGDSVEAEAATMTLVESIANKDPLDGEADYNKNNYIDIPVWFRSSLKDDTQLSVKATAFVGSSSSGDLYKAVRASILNSSDGSASPAASVGVIIPFDGSTQQYVEKYYAHTGTGDGSTNGKALARIGTVTSDGSETSRTGEAYDNVDAVAQTGATTPDTVVTVKGTEGSATVYNGNCADNSERYADATCVIVRVWLEGEDTDCWNSTAGQDFKLGLKFEAI